MSCRETDRFEKFSAQNFGGKVTVMNKIYSVVTKE